MNLYYEIHGEGHPVVLLHGGGSDLRIWNFLVPLLEKDYQVITVDARGIGQSSTPESDINYVEDVLLLINNLSIDKPSIIGHSMGGQVAIEFSLVYPQRVNNLVLIAPALSGFKGYTEFEEIMQQVMNSAPNIDKMIEVMLNSPLYQVVARSSQKDLAVQMLRDQFQRMMESPPFEIKWPSPPAIERLDKLTANTLFIIGENELQENFLAAEYFEKVQQITFVELSGADHILPLTHYEILHSEVNAFMKE